MFLFQTGASALHGARPAGVPCFLIEPTDRYRVSLRRYSPSTGRPCPSRGEWGCDASTFVGVEAHAEHPGWRDDHVPHDDPRWPAACEHCGRAFEEGDVWQVFPDRVFARPDTGEEHSLRALPPGAMYDATWLPTKGADGRSLILQLPDGRPWWIDGGSTNGGGWTRTGAGAAVTARPSILTPGYHGFLTDGVLVPC